MRTRLISNPQCIFLGSMRSAGHAILRNDNNKLSTVSTVKTTLLFIIAAHTARKKGREKTSTREIINENETTQHTGVV